MHEHSSGTTRRAVLRSVPTPVDVTPDVEVWVYDAPPLLEVIDDLPEPRIADLDALLRDVDQLRASLRRDLTLAATAADAGETELAAWLLFQDERVRAFQTGALGRLEDLAEHEQAEQAAALGGRRSRRMLTAAPFAAVAAFVFAFVGGVVPSGPQPVASPRTTNVALESYEAFTQLALAGGSASAITAAAEKFHDDLAPLVDSPLTDPAAVNHAILLLQSERAVLLAGGGGSSRELTQILREADRLVARLKAGLARRPLPIVIADPIIPAPERDRHEPERKASSPKPSSAAKPGPTASARPSPKPTSSPSPKASEPASQPSQGPGTSPTDGPLPKAPGIG